MHISPINFGSGKKITESYKTAEKESMIPASRTNSLTEFEWEIINNAVSKCKDPTKTMNANLLNLKRILSNNDAIKNYSNEC